MLIASYWYPETDIWALYLCSFTGLYWTYIAIAQIDSGYGVVSRDQTAFFQYKRPGAYIESNSAL